MSGHLLHTVTHTCSGSCSSSCTVQHKELQCPRASRDTHPREQQHRLTRNCAKGEHLKQETPVTLLNHPALACTGRAQTAAAAAVHCMQQQERQQRRAAVIARWIAWDILTSLRLRHFPSALMRGRGSTKDFAFFLTPSLHRTRSGASAGSLCNKDAEIRASIFMHLEPFRVPVRARPCTGRCSRCTAASGGGGTAESRKCSAESSAAVT